LAGIEPTLSYFKCVDADHCTPLTGYRLILFFVVVASLHFRANPPDPGLGERNRDLSDFNLFSQSSASDPHRLSLTVFLLPFSYTLQASTFQMAVLLQYNDSDQWTVSHLAESTGIKKDILIQVTILTIAISSQTVF
jgi:hypothetical protein